MSHYHPHQQAACLHQSLSSFSSGFSFSFRFIFGHRSTGPGENILRLSQRRRIYQEMQSIQGREKEGQERLVALFVTRAALIPILVLIQIQNLVQIEIQIQKVSEVLPKER